MKVIASVIQQVDFVTMLTVDSNPLPPTSRRDV